MSTTINSKKSSSIRIEDLTDDELLMLNIVNKRGEMDEHYTVNWQKARFVEKVAYYDSVSKSLLLSSKGKKLLEAYRLNKKYSVYNYRKSHIEDVIYYMQQQLINEKDQEKKKQIIHERINENVTMIDDNTFYELYESASQYYCVNAIKSRELQLQSLDEQLKIKESIQYLMNLEEQLNNNELMMQILIQYYKDLKTRIQ
jgi:hypothetical protein